MEENVQKDGTVSFVTAQRQVSLVQRVEGVSLSHIFGLVFIQPWPLAYKRLLSKPYVNEVALTRQNPPLKGC